MTAVHTTWQVECYSNPQTNRDIFSIHLHVSQIFHVQFPSSAAAQDNRIQLSWKDIMKVLLIYYARFETLLIDNILPETDISLQNLMTDKQ